MRHHSSPKTEETLYPVYFMRTMPQMNSQHTASGSFTGKEKEVPNLSLWLIQILKSSRLMWRKDAVKWTPLENSEYTTHLPMLSRYLQIISDMMQKRRFWQCRFICSSSLRMIWQKASGLQNRAFFRNYFIHSDIIHISRNCRNFLTSECQPDFFHMRIRR